MGETPADVQLTRDLMRTSDQVASTHCISGILQKRPLGELRFDMNVLNGDGGIRLKY